MSGSVEGVWGDVGPAKEKYFYLIFQKYLGILPVVGVAPPVPVLL